MLGTLPSRGNDVKSWQIIQAFSEIKLLFIERARLKKSPYEIRLWFSYEKGVLKVHSYQNHEIFEILMTQNNQTGHLTICLNDPSLASSLIKYTLEANEGTNISAALNSLYDSYGYIP